MTRYEAVSSWNPTEAPGCSFPRTPHPQSSNPSCTRWTPSKCCLHTRWTVILGPLRSLSRPELEMMVFSLEFRFRSVRFSICEFFSFVRIGKLISFFLLFFPKLGKHGVGRGEKKPKNKKENFSLSHPREACQRVRPFSCWLDARPHPQKPRLQRTFWRARASTQPGGLPSSPGH